MKIVEEKGLTRENVFNCDETGLYWKLMPNKTFVTAGESAAKGSKKPKERVTLMACANAAGTVKFPLVFINNPRCLIKINYQWITLHSKVHGWIPEFLRNGFLIFSSQDANNFFEGQGCPAKAPLVLDNAPSHPRLTYFIQMMET